MCYKKERKGKEVREDTAISLGNEWENQGKTKGKKGKTKGNSSFFKGIVRDIDI